MKMKFAGLCLAAAMACTPMSLADEATNPDLEYETAKDIIWTKELGIYAGRGEGNLLPYRNCEQGAPSPSSPSTEHERARSEHEPRANEPRATRALSHEQRARALALAPTEAPE